MLLTFRLFVFASGLVIVALAVTTRGLVPEPEARTRIGEVPTLGRSLVQQAIIPPAAIERQLAAEIGPVGELRGTHAAPVPAAAGALAIGSRAGGSMSASELVASVGPHDGPAPSVTGEDLTKLREAPDPASPQDVAQAPSGTGEAFDREAPDSAHAPPPATKPAAAPAKPALDHEAMAPGRSSSGAVESLFVAPRLPSLAALRLSVSPGLNELAETPVPAGVPTMAFAAEPETGRRKGDAANRTDANLPADATASDPGALSGSALETKPSKKTKNARASRQLNHSAAKRSHKKVKVSHRTAPAKGKGAAHATPSSAGAINVVQGVPQSYQYLYAVPLRAHLNAPGWTAVR